MSKPSNLYILAIVIFLGTCLRVLLAFLFGYEPDSSMLLYQAHMASTGATMFGDIHIEEPLYVYVLSGIDYLFGFRLWTIRAFSLVSSVASIVLVYLVARSLFGEKTGLISATLYSVVPPVAFFGVVDTYRSAIVPFELAALYLTLSALKNSNYARAVLAALIIGVTIWLYFGMIVYAPIIISLSFVYRHSLLVKITRVIFWQLLGLIGGVLLVIPFILIKSTPGLIYNTWFQDHILGFGGGPASRFSSLLSLTNYLNFALKYTYVEVRDWLPLVASTCVYIVSMIAIFIHRRRTLAKNIFIVVVYVFVAIAFVIIGMGQFLGPHNGFGIFEVPRFFASIFIWLSVTFLPIGIAAVKSIVNRIPNFSVNDKAWFVWFLWLFIFLLSFSEPNTFYFYGLFAAPLSISGGYVIHTISPSKFGNHNSALCFAVVIFFILSAAEGIIAFTDTTIPDVGLRSNDIQIVASYIDNNTSPGDYIFSAVPVYALYANRPNAANFDNFFWYINTKATSVNSSPVISGVYSLMREGRIRYVIMDPYIGGETFLLIQHYPLLWKTFQTSYSYVTTLGGASLWLYEPKFNLTSVYFRSELLGLTQDGC